MTNSGQWHIHIDTGGTFTDCIAEDPEGEIHRVKVLSSSSLRGRIIRKIDPYNYSFEAPWNYPGLLLEGYTILVPSRGIQSKLLAIDYRNHILTLENNIPALSNCDFDLTTQEEAPVLAIRLATRTKIGSPFPPIHLRLGTTKGTNALLEKKGAKSLLVVTKGYRDLLRIGTQQRPHLFQLAIPDPELQYADVFEVDERIDAKGDSLTHLSPTELDRLLAHIQESDFEAVAVSLLNAYKNPAHENLLTDFVRNNTDLYVSSAVELFPQINYLRRTQTAAIDAYLSPIIDSYLNRIRKSLKGTGIQVATSAGGLVNSAHYHAKDSLLSGPAGGMIAATRLAEVLGISKILTFDMGGTSTDTARIDGRPQLSYITKINNYELLNPSFAIETVAAGGGSVCWYDGYTLRVGPHSAGATPGPACYGAGGPLTVTDVNLLLGKLETSQFEIPISPGDAMDALHKLIEDIAHKTGSTLGGREVLKGLERIANEKMAEAIRKISVSQGVNPSEYALMTFGGAGGQHGCQLAQLLNIDRVIIPREAGLFSAVGIGQAQLSRIATRQVLQPWKDCHEKIPSWILEMEDRLSQELDTEGAAVVELGFCSLFLRFTGQETTLEIPYHATESQEIFRQSYLNLYGYLPTNKSIELESIRLMMQEKKEFPSQGAFEFIPIQAPSVRKASAPFSGGNSWPIYHRADLMPGHFAMGPCVITESNSTTYVPPGWQFSVQSSGDLIISHTNPAEHSVLEERPEEVELELFTNRFYAIAEEMGVQLQRTAFSVNVKERLDFSCALLDADAELLVNAPHIPVHLGSLGLCARLVREKITIGPGDVVITNHPKYGGSHLPDVTLLAGVYTVDAQLVGYVMNRAHHAEIGGTRPGSMPPDANSLAEEGVTILPQYLVKKGVPQWDSMRALFTEGTYPTRMWVENEADMIAALSSLRKGQTDLLALVSRFGLTSVRYYMGKLKSNAHAQLQIALRPYENKKMMASEFLDDGHRIAVQIEVQPGRILFDFKSTSHVHPHNLNANLSILHSAILYVLRILVDKEIPLNDGLMKDVHICLPENSLLNPHFEDDPALCPAVVGGNTEVSQRLVDTLLKALELAACSQGTMNNFLFGNDHLGYYETIGGGAGAGPGFHGRSGVHQHMTNTRITDTEELERRYPVRIPRFELRSDSGGKGQWHGGEGIVREIEFLDDLDITLLTQHRYFAPYGMAGGENGKSSDHTLIRASGKIEKCPGVCSAHVKKNDRLLIETPGGGGYGEPH
ncbi:hydantoinase B/oxoprolinase family protein [Salmonirosea aquatica]|uniref:5-oxoprolinase n=1 Tax=Salmonirosea aquatica TaxID=2654236 RepID=A0A7C9FZY3_9BACT|nr:5-oxoprolinase [Cytophagaceae bacterium SJW1-29]